MEFTAKQIAGFINGEIVGDENISVNTFSKIEEGKPGSLTFLSNPKYTNYIYSTEASIVLVSKSFVPEREVKATMVKVDNPYDALARLLMMYESAKPKKKGIDSLAFISPSAKLGDNVYVGPFAYIGENAVIGDDVKIYPHAFVGDNVKVGDNTLIYQNVNIYSECRIGENCVLHAGCVIGADGFGFAPTEEGYEKIPQIGNVVLEDNVEIGANTCIDRATMGSTILHKGVKIDNLVQIAHNDEIGANTVIAAQTGVAGSTKIGEWCMFGGQVGVAGHITVGNKVNVGAQTGINSHAEGNQTLMGYPAMSYRDFMKTSVLQRKLPDMYRKMDMLEKELKSIKELLDR